jgi:hypothetical protein
MDMSVNVNYIADWMSIEPYFWTKDEVGELSNEWSIKSATRNFTLDEYNFHWEFTNPQQILSTPFKPGWLNVLLITKHGLTESDYGSLLDRLEGLDEGTKVLIVIAKHTEDYFMLNETRTSTTLLERIEKMRGVKVVWDIPFINYTNFKFSNKVALQSYYNNEVFPGEMFFYGGEVFSGYPKRHRVGLHINKLTDRVRIGLAKHFLTNENIGLKFTTNTSPTHNQRYLPLLNYTSPHFNPYLSNSGQNNGIHNNSYTHQFIEHTIHSQMEVVYETFTIISPHLHLIKFNEKTTKLLYLGKPFIHTDPLAHKLMEMNSLTPYRSLYTDELWDIYSNWDISKRIDGNDSSWIPALIRNIEWLRDMKDSEWQERIEVANTIATDNRRYCNELIFVTHLREHLKF